jgi:dihydroflavonol-4-reductase
MKVLVTGATGFIGGNLARELWQRGYEVTALARPGSNRLTIEDTGIEVAPGDLLEPESVERAMQGCQAVFHCAAAYTFWTRDPASIYRTNVEGTRIVLEAARKAGVERVVYTSTVATIGIPPAPPLGKAGEAGLGLGDEDTEVDHHHLVGNYKKSKFQAEQVALQMAGEGLPVVVVNPTAPIGPWDVKPTPTGRIVLDFLKGRIPAYVDAGMNLVDVSDVAVGHILAWEKGIPGQRYLLGHRNLSLKEVFDLLQTVSGRPAPRWKAPHWLALAAGYVDQLVEGVVLRREPRIPVEGLKIARRPMYVSCRKAVEQLGLPQTPVEAALEKSIHWFTRHGYV